MAERKDNPDGTYTLIYPNGKQINYEADGTVCRSCNTLLDFKSANFMNKPKKTEIVDESKLNGYTKDCPADSVKLGNGTWTLLHTIAAKFPDNPNPEQQSEVKEFVKLLSKLYPCWYCAKDFKEYIKENEIKVTNKNDFGTWLCNAHNNVNVKLGKPVFDCNLWKQRWKDGWKDGSCD